MSYKIIDNLLGQVYKYRNRELYSFIDQDTMKWVSTSWKSFLEKTEGIARGLLTIGVEPGQLVAVCSPNCPQILALDYALYMIRAVVVPIGHQESQTVFNHVMDLTEAEVVFVGDENQYAKVREYIRHNPGHKIRHIVMVWGREKERSRERFISENIWDLIARGDDEKTHGELDSRMASADEKDLALVIFTTGTTGMPKGVMLAHEQLDAGLEMHDRFLTALTDDKLSLSYLPMSHIFEKAWLYICVRRGVRIAFCYDTSKVQETLLEVHPDTMCCVPRFWEKLYTCFYNHYHKQNWLGKRMINRAFHVGKRRNLYYRRNGKKVPSRVEREYRFWDRKVFSRLREITGLKNPGIYPTAGSMLNDKIMGFMLKAGFDIMLGYGMTETTATITIFPWLYPVVGTVGRPLDRMRLKIADNGEIMVKGPTVMRGYYKDEEATKAAFDEEGYLHTGDLGFINPDGSLVVTGRIKEIYKTSTGKSIPPVYIENTIMESPLIERAVAVADSRKYVTAIVYPETDMLRRMADEAGVDYADVEELLGLEWTRRILLEEVRRQQKEMSPYMHVHDIGIMRRDLSKEKGEIGVSGKLRRKVIRDNFRALIDSLYEEEFIDAEPLFVSGQPKR